MRRVPLAKAPEGWATFDAHPLAELAHIPTDPEPLAALIQEFGYDEKEPVTLLWCERTERWLIFDGLLRRRACVLAEEEPVFEQIVQYTEAQLRGFIKRKLARQHLNESQRGFIAAGLVTTEHAGRPAAQPDGSISTTTAKAAEMLNTSERTVVRAKTVHEDGSEAIKRAVRVGQVSVSDASSIVHLGHDEQDAALAKLVRGEVRTLLEAVEGPILCRQCKKGKPTPHCPACDEERHLRRLRGKPKEKAKAANTRTITTATFTWEAWTATIRKLSEMADSLARRKKIEGSDAHKAMITAIDAVAQKATEMDA